jgi:azurin
MITNYKAYDTKEKDVFVSVDSNYFKISDAKEVYQNSLINKGKDDSILFEVANEELKKKISVISIGVSDAEKMALVILNICNSIKG